MIAKAKAVAHGIRAMLYVSGESRNKKHPEKITRICDNFMPQGLDATGIWTEMKFATMNHPNIRNNVIRMEISPAMEHTKNLRSMTGNNFGKTLRWLLTNRLSVTRTAKPFPTIQMYRAASLPYGCMRNPRAAYRTYMPSSAGWTKTGTSTRPRHPPAGTTSGGKGCSAKRLDNRHARA